MEKKSRLSGLSAGWAAAARTATSSADSVPARSSPRKVAMSWKPIRPTRSSSSSSGVAAPPNPGSGSPVSPPRGLRRPSSSSWARSSSRSMPAAPGTSSTASRSSAPAAANASRPRSSCGSSRAAMSSADSGPAWLLSPPSRWASSSSCSSCSSFCSSASSMPAGPGTSSAASRRSAPTESNASRPRPRPRRMHRRGLRGPLAVPSAPPSRRWTRLEPHCWPSWVVRTRKALAWSRCAALQPRCDAWDCWMPPRGAMLRRVLMTATCRRGWWRPCELRTARLWLPLADSCRRRCQLPWRSW
mmetsp:Transcript_20873/g.67149  ORF Transcript_20873/g.67149 Transcript_20873/m.67149 type:complete len:301 (-) Transcript_20873:119-1021(-)